MHKKKISSLESFIKAENGRYMLPLPSANKQISLLAVLPFEPGLENFNRAARRFSRYKWENLSKSAKRAVQDYGTVLSVFEGKNYLGYFHINPDGMHGGFVDFRAVVEDSYIDATSAVLGRSEITGKSEVQEHSIAINSKLLGESVIMERSRADGCRLTGRSEVSAHSLAINTIISSFSVVSGNSVVITCSVEGRSLIDSSSIASFSLISDSVLKDGSVGLNARLVSSQIHNSFTSNSSFMGCSVRSANIINSTANHSHFDCSAINNSVVIKSNISNCLCVDNCTVLMVDDLSGGCFNGLVAFGTENNIFFRCYEVSPYRDQMLSGDFTFRCDGESIVKMLLSMPISHQ